MKARNHWRAAVVIAFGALAAGLACPARGAETGAETAAQLPEGIELEQAVTDPAATKVVLVAGSNYFKPGQHDYRGGCGVLMNLLRQTPGVVPVLALDWPQKPETLEGAKAVVFYFDGGAKHAWVNESHRAETKKLADAGVGFVCFHQCVDVPEQLGPQVREWIGATFEKGYSQRAHWVAEFKTFPDHPICRGVEPFKIDDGWLFKLRFADGLSGVTPLLSTVSPKAKSPPAKPEDSIVSWAYQRAGGGRSFAFTGCHLHASLAEAGYRRYLVNGILWTAGLDVPQSGAPVEFDATQLDRYLSAAPPGKPAK